MKNCSILPVGYLDDHAPDAITGSIRLDNPARIENLAPAGGIKSSAIESGGRTRLSFAGRNDFGYLRVKFV
jgi:hypothetical protein